MPKIVEKITPYGGDDSKGVQIEQAFDRIAPRYDFMNRLLSLRLDVTWRKRALKTIPGEPSSILDLATGTGDLAILEAQAFPQAKVTGIDLSTAMLSRAEKKTQRKGLPDRISFMRGDCLALPFEDNSFDAATIAFGIRNFENLTDGCKEAFRILRPGGILVIPELSRPQITFFSDFYHLYPTKVTPALGKLFTGRIFEYAYLQKSIDCVPQGEEMLNILHNAGFTDCRVKTYTFGTCSCYTAAKPVKRIRGSHNLKDLVSKIPPGYKTEELD